MPADTPDNAPEDCGRSDTSHTTVTTITRSLNRVYTPQTSVCPDGPEELLWSGRGAVPWAGNTYHIIEKGSGKAITLVGDEPKLKSFEDNKDPHTRWLVVERNGYFGLHSPHTGRYIGHDSESKIGVWADKLDEWELWTPRQHPEGGYQLLSPFWAHTLRALCVEWDGERLVRRDHGNTLWEFVLV